MPFLKLARPVHHGTEILSIGIGGPLSNYWINKEVRARDDDDNQTPWRIFSIISEEEYSRQFEAVRKTRDRRPFGLSAQVTKAESRHRNSGRTYRVAR